MTNPTGVPDVTNTARYPTRPRWTLTFTVRGQSFERSYDVLRETEARSRLAADEPEATVTAAAFSEVPL